MFLNCLIHLHRIDTLNYLLVFINCIILSCLRKLIVYQWLDHNDYYISILHLRTIFNRRQNRLLQIMYGNMVINLLL